MKTHRSQSGIALIIFVFMIAIMVTGYLLYSLNAVDIKNEKDKKTAEALVQAKVALLGYAASRDLTSIICGTNCPRPGDLPCPDTDNNGSAETSCGNSAGTTGQADRLGRLPWKTLGLPDLRDGDGERLWYAVSSRYKNNTRFFPLNSDTTATISLRSSNGGALYDGANSNGVVAVVIAPGAAFVRQDNIAQTRDAANQNIASNYLDVALGEDNQDFVDSDNNGFIEGPIRDINGNVILNDHLLAITRQEMNQIMESRVLAEVRANLTNYFSGVGASSYPFPANFNDSTCLGNIDILNTNCLEGTVRHGRIPASPVTPWDANSILRGSRTNNWFQLNSWREVLYYAVATACVTGTSGCSIGSMLTLNNSLIAPSNDKQFVVISTGANLVGQVRDSIADKIDEVNYLESENINPNPPDDIYVRTLPTTSIVNDRAISLP